MFQAINRCEDLESKRDSEDTMYPIPKMPASYPCLKFKNLILQKELHKTLKMIFRGQNLS